VVLPDDTRSHFSITSPASSNGSIGNIGFSRGMKSPASGSESTLPLTNEEYPGRGTDHLGPALGENGPRLLLDHPLEDGNTVRLPDFPPVGVGIEPVVTDHDLALFGDVRGHPGEKLQVVRRLQRGREERFEGWTKYMSANGDVGTVKCFVGGGKNRDAFRALRTVCVGRC
jgi:hypothetical protein